MARILVVDDEAGMRAVISKILLPQGHKIIQAEDGKQALELCESETVHLVLLDIRLPDFDGLEILANIRSMKPDLPVIMLSGFGDVETAVELVRQGAFDYISKPFKVDRLVTLVNEALAQAGITSSEEFLKEEPAPQAEAQPVPPPQQVQQQEPAKTAASASAPAQQSADTADKSADSEEDEEPRKKPIWIFASIGIFILLAGGIFSLIYFTREPPLGKFPIPYTNPSAICWDGENIWIGDWMEETIYKHKAEDKRLRILSAYKLAGMQITGIAYDGENIWTSDSFERKIYKHRMNYNLTIDATYDAPGPSISGLYYDGDSLWSMDFQLGKIFQHAFDDNLSVLDMYESPAKNPCAIFQKGKYFYITDASSNLIYKVNKADFSIEEVYVIERYKDQRYHLAGLAFDGKSVWSCADEMNKVLRHPFSSLKEIEK